MFTLLYMKECSTGWNRLNSTYEMAWTIMTLESLGYLTLIVLHPDGREEDAQHFKDRVFMEVGR